jgi:hypothetical protein
VRPPKAFAVLPFAFSFAALLTSCEPGDASAGGGVVVNDVPCEGGVVALDFPDLTVGAPAGRTVFVRDAQGGVDGVIEADVGFGEGTDPAFSLLRDPFIANDALVLPLRIQPTQAGSVAGSFVIVLDDALACTVQLSASTA